MQSRLLYILVLLLCVLSQKAITHIGHLLYHSRYIRSLKTPEEMLLFAPPSSVGVLM